MKSDRGFTLVELLVAMAITSVLVTLLVGVVSATMNVWNQGRNQIDTLANARQVLTRMADELKGAIASSQVQFAENSDSLAITPPVVARTQENIFFVAPYPNSAAGDLCVIAYRLNNGTHELQRAFLDSQTAWNNASPTRYRIAGYTGPLGSGSASWRTIAEGVIEFEVRSFSQADLDGGNNTPADTWNSIGGTSEMVGNVPRRIVVRLKVVDDKALARLKVSSGTAYNGIIAQSAREFTADINLLSPHPTPTPTP